MRVLGLISGTSHDGIDAAVVESGVARGTLQIGQLAWIAERTGTPVVADLRARDLAAGGQGAPLVALMDILMLGGEPGAATLNLGGIANITITGKELFHKSYVDGDGPDVVATVTALTAETVAAQVTAYGIGTLAVSGGGCRNPVLMAMLRIKEAIAFALLGWLTAHGLPGNLRSCTGARDRRLPPPLAEMPRRLVLEPQDLTGSSTTTGISRGALRW